MARLLCLLLLHVGHPSRGDEEDADFGMEELHIANGSQVARLFSQADLNSDGMLNSQELANLRNLIESGFSVQPNIDPEADAVLLYSGSNCSGGFIAVPQNAREALCSKCFDLCNKSFSGNRTPTNHSQSILHVGSLRVLQGQIRVRTSNCHGTMYRGDKSFDPALIITMFDPCFGFEHSPPPVHIELQMGVDARRGVDVYFAFHREDSEGHLPSTAASDMDAAIFEFIDESGDGKISRAELATFIDSFQNLPENDFDSGIGTRAYEDAARAMLRRRDPSVQVPSAADVEAEAIRLFSDEYKFAKLAMAHKPESRANGTANDHSQQYEVEAGQTDGGRVRLCADGRLSSLDLCYKPCNLEHPKGVLDRCWASCPSGTTDVGLFCVESLFKWHSKSNYYRGVGIPPKTCQLGGSFGPGKFVGSPMSHFTAAVVSDPQLPWCSGEKKGDMACALAENIEMVRAANMVSSTLSWTNLSGSTSAVHPLSGVFLNGDLTAFGMFYEIDAFRKIWETSADASWENNLKLPIWPGLGNHDIANNVGDCNLFVKEVYWLGYGFNGCAERMLAYARAAVAGCDGHVISPSFGGRVDHYDQVSAAYTVVFGRLRAVMLHNYPSFDGKTKLGSLDGFQSTISFLRREVEYANTTGSYLMLFIHDLGDHFGWSLEDQDYREFAELVSTSQIIGIFSGHWHFDGGSYFGNLGGEKGVRPNTSWQMIKNRWGDEVPSLRSFSTEARKFLVMEYDEKSCEWRYGAVSAAGGVPSWYNSSNPTYNAKYVLRDCNRTGGDGPKCVPGMCLKNDCGCFGQDQCLKGRCIRWSAWISEESGETSDSNFAASGLGCQGRYCNHVRLRHEVALPAGSLAEWSAWASDDGDTQISACPAEHVVTRIACEGRYCDNIRVQCRSFGKFAQDSHWTSNWFSEEDSGQATCPDGFAITALECHARECAIGWGCLHYCDSKRLHCDRQADCNDEFCIEVAESDGPQWQTPEPRSEEPQRQTPEPRSEDREHEGSVEQLIAVANAASRNVGWPIRILTLMMFKASWPGTASRPWKI